jgi:hypothetical protein
MVAIQESPILTELCLILPEGCKWDHLYCDSPGKWKDVTNKSMMKDLVKHFPAWQGVRAIRVGGTEYGDEVFVTGPDPLSPNGAIYADGEMAGPQDIENWPECMLRLGFTAEQWIDRVNEFGDDYCVCPGSIDQLLGERAHDYRQALRALNPGINW